MLPALGITDAIIRPSIITLILCNTSIDSMSLIDAISDYYIYLNACGKYFTLKQIQKIFILTSTSSKKCFFFLYSALSGAYMLT